MPPAAHDTMAHLVGYRTLWATKPPNYCNLVKRTIQNAHRKKNAIEYSNELEGGLFFPSHNLVIASYSTNNHLYVDVHGMAKSEADGLPSVPHMVITKADADAALNFHKSRGTKPNYITSGMLITTSSKTFQCPKTEASHRHGTLRIVQCGKQCALTMSTSSMPRHMYPRRSMLTAVFTRGEKSIVAQT